MAIFGAKDLAGQRFGKLVVIERDGSKKRSNGSVSAMWKCQCDCGNIASVSTTDLTMGMVKSCGCLRLIHGDSHGGENYRLYSIWKHMRRRCYDKNNDHYKWYGSVGIEVCNEWQDYLLFKEWALSNGYTSELTIDRIDPLGNYCPENCRWVDYRTQENNKRNTKRYEYNGECHTLSEWSDIVGIKASTLYGRVRDSHWDIEKALTTPVKTTATEGGTP